jgi:glycosyltransferase involved in cell wall biosynthesis
LKSGLNGTMFVIMKVRLDLTPALHNTAGTGRYVRELSKALVDLGHGDQLTFFCVDPEGGSSVGTPDSVPRKTIRCSKQGWSAAAALSSYLGIPMDRFVGEADVFHATWHLLPRLRSPASVMTLYDLAFVLYPETHLRVLRWSSNVLVPRYLRACDRIIAISESTKRDAIRMYRIPEDKIVVTHLAAEVRFRPENPDRVAEVRRRFGLPLRFLLYVGTIEPRKNLDVLLGALSRLKGQGCEVPLVVAGKLGWLYDEFLAKIRSLGLESLVLLPGFVPEDDLPALYTAAEVFVYPSVYEGFGIPILEAMGCGTPVLCSNVSSLPEVTGDGGILLPPRDPAAWAEAIARLTERPVLRRELRERGFRQASRFRWEETAKRTWEVYRATLSHRSHGSAERNPG